MTMHASDDAASALIGFQSVVVVPVGDVPVPGSGGASSTNTARAAGTTSVTPYCGVVICAVKANAAPVVVFHQQRLVPVKSRIFSPRADAHVP